MKNICFKKLNSFLNILLYRALCEMKGNIVCNGHEHHPSSQLIYRTFKDVISNSDSLIIIHVQFRLFKVEA